MSVNGDDGAPPMRAAPPISDLVAGSYAAMGIMAALVRRARTGQGEEVATALTDSMTSMLAYLAANYFATGKLPLRTGNEHAIASPYGLFEASDGQVAIAPANDAVYFKLLAALELDHLKERPEFLTTAHRFAQRDAINQEINARIRHHTVAHWIEALNAAGVPCGRVLDLEQVFEDPQTRHQQMRITINHPRYGPLDVLGFAIKFSDEPCRVHRVPPVLGADTDAVLQEAGFDAAAIAALRAGKVV